MKKTATTLAVCLLILPGVSAWAEDAGAKALFEKKCSTCHGIDRPMSKKKSAEDWAKTVERMKSNGCALTDDESKAIVEYLAKNHGI